MLSRPRRGSTGSHQGRSAGEGHSEVWKSVVGELGLEELAQEVQEIEDEEGGAGAPQGLDASAEAETTFNAMQMVLSNMMVVSALLLGFIVTGTLLSIGLTGRDNFGIDELIEFFRWSSLACMCAFVSLITSFLTSMWGAHRLTTSGPAAAAKALTHGSVLRRIVAEGGLYLSMFFFLVSLDKYIWMVYSGPDICPTYRGEAAFCARQGKDLYDASFSYCSSQRPSCGEDQGAGEEVVPRGPCHANTTMWECLCEEVCSHKWKEEYDWDRHYPANRGVRAYHYNWFGYRPFDFKEKSKATREKVMVASSALMCNHETLEEKKDACFADGRDDCNAIFKAWKLSEDCMEASIQDAIQCAKVCSWTHGFPPREALMLATQFAFIPLGATLLLLTLGRVMVITLRACVVVNRQQSALASSLRSALNNRRGDDGGGDDDDDEESD